MRIRQKEIEQVVFDMTPMIDIVFQLIIFFMLITDLANTQLERVTLPKASEVKEDKQPPKDRLVVNLAHILPRGVRCKELKYEEGYLVRPCQNKDHWKVKIDNKEIKMTELIKILIVEGDLKRARPDDRTSLSERILMVRADAGAPYRMLEKVLTACARAKIYKLEIGASQP